MYTFIDSKNNSNTDNKDNPDNISLINEDIIKKQVLDLAENGYRVISLLVHIFSMYIPYLKDVLRIQSVSI